MNIIEKYKLKKIENQRVNIVINSTFDYKDHDLNIFKECLSQWSKDMNNCHTNIKYDWIYSNPDQKEKIFFVSTTIKELKQHKLDKLITNEKILSCSYMTTEQNRYVFPLLDHESKYMSYVSEME